MTTDAQTLAYINLFGILGALPYLCELDHTKLNNIAITLFINHHNIFNGSRKFCNLRLPLVLFVIYFFFFYY